MPREYIITPRIICFNTPAAAPTESMHQKIPHHRGVRIIDIFIIIHTCITQTSGSNIKDHSYMQHIIQHHICRHLDQVLQTLDMWLCIIHTCIMIKVICIMDTCIMDTCNHRYKHLGFLHHGHLHPGYMHHVYMHHVYIHYGYMHTRIIDTCIMDTCIMDTCIMDSSVWVKRPERPKVVKNKVKRPEGPPARSRGPEGF